MKKNNAKTMYPWEYAKDKNNLWREYTLEECGLEDTNKRNKNIKK